MLLQSIIFKRKTWTRNEAIKWVRMHGYHDEIETNDKYYRFKQIAHEPGDKYIAQYVEYGVIMIFVVDVPNN
jgi:hypothetical protein